MLFEDFAKICTRKNHTQCCKITQMPATLCTLDEVALTPTLIAL